MDACMDACIDACMHPCMHGCMHAWMHACMHGCMHACMDACMHGCMHACMHACIHACMHPSMHPCMHASMFLKWVQLLFLKWVQFLGLARLYTPHRQYTSPWSHRPMGPMAPRNYRSSTELQEFHPTTREAPNYKSSIRQEHKAETLELLKKEAGRRPASK